MATREMSITTAVSGSYPCRRLLMLVVLAIASAASAGCGSDSENPAAVESEESVEADIEDSTTVEEQEATVTVDGEELRLVTIDPPVDGVELVQYTSSAMGGVRFAADPAHHVLSPGDGVVVSVSDPAGEQGWETAFVQLLTQSADGQPVEGVDQVIELTAATPSAQVTPTGTAIDVLGYQLVGYDIRAAASTQDRFLYAADRIGGPATTFFSFFPNGRVFLTETPAGVLIAGAALADEVSGIDAIEPALGTLIATLEFTGDGLDSPLPPGEALAPEGIPPSDARGTADPDGPTSLEASFSSVAAGSYQLKNFGRTFAVDLGDDWHVQPNFPGFVALSDASSGGPGDRDLTFHAGIVDLLPLGAGPVPAGEPITVTTADQMIEALGVALEVTEVEEVDVGGVPATRFDVHVPAGAACSQDDPCEFAFRTTAGIVWTLKPTYSHRIWWLDEGPEGPSIIMAMAPRGHDFIERATDVVATMSFN